MIKSVMIVGVYPNKKCGLKGGGPAIYTENLAGQLSKKLKVNVVSLSFNKLKEQTRFKINENLYVKYIYNSRKSKRIFFTVKAVLYSILKKNEYDIAHFQDVKATYFYGLLNWLFKKPVVMTMHGYLTLEGVANGRYKKNSMMFKVERWMEKKAVERADAIIAVGKTLREWIIKELGANADKVFYVPNGIDPEIFKPIPTEKNPLAEKYKGFPILLFTKHFSPRYGAKDLILAFKKIVEEYPDAKLIMLGDDKWRREIINYTFNVGLKNNVIFPGRVENNVVPYYLSLADVFINPTAENETFGISVIEAMACEKPVVATAVGGPKEIMEEGIRQMGKPVGILAPPKNPSPHISD